MRDGFTYNDGGRAKAGYKGSTGDCVCRSIATVTGLPYQEVYDFLAHGNATQKRTKRSPKHRIRSAAQGIMVKRKWFKDYMTTLGFRWVPTMKIGEGCKVHLDAKELPAGRLVIALSKHYTAMIDGVIHDTYDPRRDDSWEHGVKDGVPYQRKIGGRCVYGYWVYEGEAS